MTSLWSITIFFCILAAAGASLTKFEFNGTLYCPLHKYRYHLVVIEHDTVYSDSISGQDPMEARGNVDYEIRAADDWDGHYDNNFEVWMKVYHSCNDYQRRASNPFYELRRFIWVYFGTFPRKVGHTYYGTKDIELHNKGELTIGF